MRSFVDYNNSNGFTLIEVCVAMAVAIIVLGATYAVFASASRSCTLNETSVDVMQDLRTSIDFMEQDIRMAGLDRLGSANAGIVYADATNLEFTADRDLDGIIDVANVTNGIFNEDLERISYVYDIINQRLMQCLYESTGENWDTVAENVDSFQFSYLDGDDNLLAIPIADLAEIRTVIVTMSITQPAGRAEPVTREISRRILCRNLAM
jgi:type II secretory pathway component PulJ